MKRDAAIKALQSLQGPDGWRDVSDFSFDDDLRMWQPTDAFRGIVTAKAIGGKRLGWYRVKGWACVGRGSEVVATVDGARLAATVVAVCGWVDVVSKGAA